MLVLFNCHYYNTLRDTYFGNISSNTIIKCNTILSCQRQPKLTDTSTNLQ